ncbi:curli production assembly protein CsgC [Salmonella enterica subsp. diarizonae]|nr:curli production assembly protein CsgC [Salmonella enterica subsp. diarizonae]
MHTLLLLAALSNQITFTTTQQGDIYTVIPLVTLNEPCVCQVQILSVRDGAGGTKPYTAKTDAIFTC